MPRSRPASVFQPYSTIERAKVEVRQSLYFRYILSLVAMSILYVFRLSLPFPYPGFFFVPLAFCCTNLVIDAALVRRNRINIAYPILLYVDSSVAPFVFYFTGGFISPFIISHLLTVVASGLIFEDKRRLSRYSFIILFLSYVGVGLIQKYSLLDNPVAYANNLMKNNVFFYFIFIITLLILSGAYLFLEALRQHTKRTIDELVGAFQSVTQGTVAIAGQDFFASIARNLADAIQAPCVIIGGLSDRNLVFNTFAVWISRDLRDNAALEVPPILGSALLERKNPLPQSGMRMLFSNQQFSALSSFERIQGYPLNDSLGKPIGLLCILYNSAAPEHPLMDPLIKIFTSRAAAELERKQADDRRLEVEGQLAHSRKMEAIGQLAGGLAHDLGNLLLPINGYAELLSIRLGDSPNQKYLKNIFAACSRAESVINQMLTFAHKGQRPSLSRVDVHSVIGDAAALLERSVGDRIRVTTALKARATTVYTDATLLQNALLNLGINARDAIGDNDGAITYTTETTVIDGSNILCELFKACPGTYLSIHVADTGAGIEKEVLPHIFEPFFTTKQKGKGTGLGLSNVWGYVETSKGAIEVKSEAGKGTVFTIHLPLIEETPS